MMLKSPLVCDRNGNNLLMIDPNVTPPPFIPRSRPGLLPIKLEKEDDTKDDGDDKTPPCDAATEPRGGPVVGGLSPMVIGRTKFCARRGHPRITRGVLHNVNLLQQSETKSRAYAGSFGRDVSTWGVSFLQDGETHTKK
uniref:Uncharacterized protein n=1 Tax=Timema poppense TaxID=170557 RepID=A0A7R9H8T0_TIMPO|nr:unnamed protein product [Timema poppensis]